MYHSLLRYKCNVFDCRMTKVDIMEHFVNGEVSYVVIRWNSKCLSECAGEELYLSTEPVIE